MEEIYLKAKLDWRLKEYEKLKDEQKIRIDFRDRMIFITLGAIGTVFSFALEKPEYRIVLLVLPFICAVLGWTNLVNDEKISSIGRYLRTNLIVQLDNLNKNFIPLESNWEVFHRSDKERKRRKVIQFIVDISVFCLSGLFGIGSYFVLQKDVSGWYIITAIIETALLLFLLSQFFLYSDFEVDTRKEL